jgi:ferric-chelate reductase
MMIVWGLDRFIRFVSLVTLNFGYLNPWSSEISKKELDAIVEVLSPRYVRVSLYRSKHFHWRPGQNVYLSFPSISSTFSFFESHPFTISTIDDDDSKSDHGSMLVFILRVQRGFTRKLHKEASSNMTYKVFLNGPYGSPPLLIGYQTVILIAGLFVSFCHHCTLAFTCSLFMCYRWFWCCVYLAVIS